MKLLPVTKIWIIRRPKKRLIKNTFKIENKTGEGAILPLLV